MHLSGLFPAADESTFVCEQGFTQWTADLWVVDRTRHFKVASGLTVLV